jgi:hypothetical protein
MAVSLFISTPVQELAGVLGTVGQVQERLVRELRVQKPTEKINPQFKLPHTTLMTLDGIARWTCRFQGVVLFRIHSMRCGGNEPNNLEDNKHEHDDGKWM